MINADGTDEFWLLDKYENTWKLLNNNDSGYLKEIEDMFKTVLEIGIMVGVAYTSFGIGSVGMCIGVAVAGTGAAGTVTGTLITAGLETAFEYGMYTVTGDKDQFYVGVIGVGVGAGVELAADGYKIARKFFRHGSKKPPVPSSALPPGLASQSDEYTNAITFKRAGIIRKNANGKTYFQDFEVAISELKGRIKQSGADISDNDWKLFIQDCKDSESNLFIFIDQDVGKFTTWQILLKQGNLDAVALRRNPINLQKLDDFIKAEGADIAKLRSSFRNTRNPQAWLDLKLTKVELNEAFAGFKNDPPFNHTPWTKNHKSQRWKNYEQGCVNGQNSCLDFESWSNGYDGKIDLVANANKGVDDYYNTLNWSCPIPPCREKIISNITAVLPDGTVISGGRRLDIADISTKRAKEFKEYSSGKVYNSSDIRREVAMDKALLLSNKMNEIEWVFKGCVPSGPLNDALNDAGILVVLLQ